MHKLPLVLACLACTGHAQRMHSSDEQFFRRHFAETLISETALKSDDAERTRLLAMLLAMSPQAAYMPSTFSSRLLARYHKPVLGVKCRLGYHTLVMVSKEDLIRQAEQMEAQAAELRRLAAFKLAEDAAKLQEQAAQLLAASGPPTPSTPLQVAAPEPEQNLAAEPAPSPSLQVAAPDQEQILAAEPLPSPPVPVVEAAVPAPSPPAGEDLQALTVKDLKAKLKTLGLKVSGSKAELIARLEEHARAETVSAPAPAPVASGGRGVPAPEQAVRLAGMSSGGRGVPAPEPAFASSPLRAISQPTDEEDEVPPVKIADESWARSTTPGIPEHLKTRPGEPIRQLIAVEGGFIERPPPGPKKLSPEMEECKQVFIDAPEGMLPSEAWKLVKARAEELGCLEQVANGIRRDWMRARWEAQGAATPN